MCIMIFAPHPDDEALFAAGLIKRAIDDGEKVIVVNVTNGDSLGKIYGQGRICESVESMQLLGLNTDNHIFMGYGDVTLYNLYNAESDDEIIPSFVGTTTYGVPNYIQDFHSLLYGAPGEYTRRTIISDIKAILRIYKPDDIFTTSLYDWHDDHSALYFLIVKAILEYKQEIQSYSPKLYESLVWAPGVYDNWPTIDKDPDPILPFSEPPYLATTPLRWEFVDSISVPSSMLIVPRPQNLKYKAIGLYKSQANEFLYSFVKSNEFFWVRDFNNIATLANVSVSSENTSTGQLGKSAVDSIIGGYPSFTKNEWATVGELNGAWIKLSWDREYLVNNIILYDRFNEHDHIINATLTFSDGSSIDIDSLPNVKYGYPITFPPKLISWVKLTINEAIGANIGLSEFEIFQSNIAYKAMVTVSSENKPYGQLGVAAIDGRIDGYPGDYSREWVTDGELDGAWIRLNWDDEYEINSVVLFDRINGSDKIEGGTLSFSDGSTIDVGPLEPNGKATVITFSPKTINWIQFTVDNAIGLNIGLAEIEVHQNI